MTALPAARQVSASSYRDARGRIQWFPVLAHAAEIVRSYDTPVTLRQLFYRLVADGTLPNTQTYYRTLSSESAEARRLGAFPALSDRTNGVALPTTFTSPRAALDWLAYQYARDRTEGQPFTLVLGVEKDGLSAQLDSWFGDLGVPIAALGGYASQTQAAGIRRHISSQERPAVLIYAGDFDPTGEDIFRDLVEQTGPWHHAARVALSAAQVAQYNLPTSVEADVKAKLARDPRATGFRARHGSLLQVEVDALPPDVLRSLYSEAIAEFWDEDAYQAAVEAEADDIAALQELSA